MKQFDERVDAYIDRAAEFARPILIHIRRVVHEASPLLTETIKWGFPFFDYKGPVCQMAAFKKHCAFGFWKASRLDDPEHLLNPGEESAAGSFGRINSIADLPDEETLKKFVLQAIALNESGIKAPMKKPAPEINAVFVIPDYFLSYLAGHPKANAHFAAFSNSHKKEYVQWIAEAKTEATRQKRMATAVEWLSEGRSRNWKYQG